MGMGLIGAIGGTGEGLMKQGGFWAEEKKAATIAAMKDKYTRESEGRAEKRSMAAEGRAEKRALESEGRSEKRALDAEGRANTEFNRRAGSKEASTRSQSDYERDQEFADDQRRKEAGLLNTNQYRPRSEFEGSNAYETYKKNEEDQGRTAVSYQEFLAQRTGRAPAADSTGKELNSQNGNNKGKSEKKLDRKYTAASEETTKLLKEKQVPETALPNMKRAISSGKMTADQALAALKKANYPDEVIIAMMADIELSGL